MEVNMILTHDKVKKVLNLSERNKSVNKELFVRSGMRGTSTDTSE